LHAALNELDQELAKRGQAQLKDQKPLQLNIANSIWAEQTFPFLKDYLNVIAQNYGAGIQLSDFIHQHEAVRKEINGWVSNQTHDKIKDLLPEGVLDPSTRMVLVNAIYFKADWMAPFEAKDTHDAPFHLLDKSDVQVKMMSENLSGVPYAQGDEYQAVELAYQGGSAAMDIILPDEGKFSEFESGLNAQKLNEILGAMQPSDRLQLELPKFNFSAEFGLKDQLISMGMSDAFDPDHADFSGMTGTKDLYIGAVLHKAFVAVDEKGTEAAAATAVVMELSAALISGTQMTIDHPFIFVIRDLPSGQILFVGRVLNPVE
jgi:serpin B